MRRRFALFALSLVLLVATALGAVGCSGVPPVGTWPPSPGTGTGTGPGAAPPGATWEKVAPEAVGLDPVELERIAATAQAGNSNCLAVVRDGKLAGEWYFRGTDENTTQEVFSVTKSFTSTLAGIAASDGDLRVRDSASTWITEWKGTASDAVTVRNLLSHDSGRRWSTAIDYGELIRANDRTAFAIGLDQQHLPGTVWAYNNAAVQTLERVLERSTGQEVGAFAQQRLFGPLGMTQTRMTTDGARNTQTFMGIQSTCRDLARFGYLMLSGGRWGDQQIVPSWWVAEATGHSSTGLNAAYGYLWWLNRYGVIGDPLVATDLEHAANPTTTRGRLVPDAPERMFWALGLGNQLIQVDPDSRTVVVRLGTAQARPQPPTFGPTEASRVVTNAVTRR